MAFWLLAILLGFLLFAASAPSPIYGIYAKLWALSPTTVTAVFAAYAAGALIALLTTGRLPDHLGRRPVVLVALVIQVAGMLSFIVADGVAFLYIGRALQGIATGVATGAISAWILDLQPADNPGRGSVVAGPALLAGLGAGALGSGLLVEYAPNPTDLVFWLLIGVYVTAFIATTLFPDVGPRRPGALQSMRPQVSVPAVARSAFLAVVPSLIAMWALSALYLSLGPSLVYLLTESENRAIGVLVIVALMIVGAITSALVAKSEPSMLVIRGSLALVLGVGLSLVGVVTDSSAGLLAGSAIAGLGLGPAFSGVMRSLGPLAPAEKRGALFAAFYIVIYVSLSVPAVAAGLASSHFGLRTTAYVFGLTVMALASTTALAASRRRHLS